MAWQFYGFMHPEFNRHVHGIAGGKQVCGPLPKKRWVATPGDPNRYKVKGRTSKATMTARPRSSDSAMVHKAAEYARWLAARDGIALPDKAACVFWALAYPHGEKPDRRIRAVKFGTVEITLPNWDWCPVCFEHVDGDETPTFPTQIELAAVA